MKTHSLKRHSLKTHSDLLKAQSLKTQSLKTQSLKTQSFQNQSLKTQMMAMKLKPLHGRHPERKKSHWKLLVNAYETPAIKIIVGAQRKVFWAHQHFLSKSPFFKRACEGSFSESTSREIRREDDDPLLFHHVLDYLYTSAWSPKILRDGDDAIGLEGRSEDKDVRTVECSRQAQLYCMADFYGLDNMMSQAIEKLKLLAPIPLENLLTIARRTHRRIPSSDTAFREFVRTEAYKLKIDRFKSTA
ncbi:MAG: hypothetical protein M1815_005774, partial [Lichina confinis]